jgi:hypothetical protein
MNIARLVLLVLIGLGSIGYFVEVGKLMTINRVWRQKIAKLEAEIESTEASIDEVQHGNALARAMVYKPEEGPLLAEMPGGAKPGIDQFMTVLNELTAQRGGRVFTDAKRGTVVPETGETIVTISEPNPHQIVDKAILYAFDKKNREEGGAYLGEFKVVAVEVDKNTASLAPVMKQSAEQLKKIAASSSDWVLYEVMPQDRYTAFAGLTDDDLKKLLPAASVDDFLRHGRPAPEGMSAERIVDGKYVRALRDYLRIFRDFDEERVRMGDLLATQAANQALADQSLTVVKTQVEARDAEITKLQADLKKVQDEHAVFVKHQQALEAKLTVTQTEIAKLLVENKKLAAEWADHQIEAAKKGLSLSSLSPSRAVE